MKGKYQKLEGEGGESGFYSFIWQDQKTLRVPY